MTTRARPSLDTEQVAITFALTVVIGVLSWGELRSSLDEKGITVNASDKWFVRSLFLVLAYYLVSLITCVGDYIVSAIVRNKSRQIATLILAISVFTIPISTLALVLLGNAFVSDWRAQVTAGGKMALLATIAPLVAVQSIAGALNDVKESRGATAGLRKVVFVSSFAVGFLLIVASGYSIIIGGHTLERTATRDIAGYPMGPPAFLLFVTGVLYCLVAARAILNQGPQPIVEIADPSIPPRLPLGEEGLDPRLTSPLPGALRKGRR